MEGHLEAKEVDGWITEEHFLHFLKHFVEHVRCTHEKPCLLLLDNYQSHICIKGLGFAEENGIVMLSFPPHCTHCLQPPNRSIYGSFKKYFMQRLINGILITPVKV